jgi:hypothetical protein
MFSKGHQYMIVTVGQLSNVIAVALDHTLKDGSYDPLAYNILTTSKFF